MMTPLFPADPNDPDVQKDPGYVLAHSQGKKLEPLSLTEQPKGDANPAIDLIRSKIDALFAGEPDTKQEVVIEKADNAPRTKHQKFMHELSTSGKSLADIQNAWHQYY